MAGNHSRRKGYRVEAEAVRILQDAGIASERIPLSGSAGGSFAGDITAPIFGQDRRFEVKCRGTGFQTLYRWLAKHYGLVLKADRSPPLVVMRLDDFAALAIEADKKRLDPSRSKPVLGWAE